MNLIKTHAQHNKIHALRIEAQRLEDQLMQLIKLYPCWPQFLFLSLPVQLSLSILDKFNKINNF